MDDKKSKARSASLKMPAVVKENKEAAAIFRQIQTYLKAFGEVEKVDSNAVGILAFAMYEVEFFTKTLAEKGYLHVDKNGQQRRRPEVIMRKDAVDRVAQYSKLLGVDRSFREKGRGEGLAKGRRPVDKIGKLRKVG